MRAKAGETNTGRSPANKCRTRSNSASMKRMLTSSYSVRDVDCPEIKYIKRRSAKDSPHHIAGLITLFTIILSLWHHSTSSYRRRQSTLLRPIRLLESSTASRRLEESFLYQRDSDDASERQELLSQWLSQLDREIRDNIHGGIRWIRPYLLPVFSGGGSDLEDDGESEHEDGIDYEKMNSRSGRRKDETQDHPNRNQFFEVRRKSTKMLWEKEWDAILNSDEPLRGPVVDYTNPKKYKYPPLLSAVPQVGEYPPLRPLRELISAWNHDNDNYGTVYETLQHFNYSDPIERALAAQFRDTEVPFKLYNVPEVTAASIKWTDDYIATGLADPAMVEGHAEESPNNYVSFFVPEKWSVDHLGLVPARSSDWDYRTWAAHARYSDAVSLSSDQPHFYWQSRVPKEQHHQDESSWGFISKDLPSFSSRTNTFFLFHANAQKGIQCRMGERGIVAATHYDSGMNMVAMITGAKRYILQPPCECSKLGLVTDPDSPVYRHSLLNYAHMKYLDDPDVGMSAEERSWLHKASTAQSIETVLREGEVLYIPSFWFHYIVSLQKSTQCNVRSGVNLEGHPVFGNGETVKRCRDSD